MTNRADRRTSSPSRASQREPISFRRRHRIVSTLAVMAALLGVIGFATLTTLSAVPAPTPAPNPLPSELAVSLRGIGITFGPLDTKHPLPSAAGTDMGYIASVQKEFNTSLPGTTYTGMLTVDAIAADSTRTRQMTRMPATLVAITASTPVFKTNGIFYPRIVIAFSMATAERLFAVAVPAPGISPIAAATPSTEPVATPEPSIGTSPATLPTSSP